MAGHIRRKWHGPWKLMGRQWVRYYFGHRGVLTAYYGPKVSMEEPFYGGTG